MANVTSAVLGHVRISKLNDPNAFLLFAVDNLTNNSGWWTIDVITPVSSVTNPFANLEDILVSFVTTGDRGEKGQKGEKGAQGETGEKGSQGETGEKGSQGETGEKGSQGETGDKGAQGETGDKGSQGETGEKGSQGETG